VSQSVIHFPSTNSSGTYITILIPLISGNGEKPTAEKPHTDNTTPDSDRNAHTETRLGQRHDSPRNAATVPYRVGKFLPVTGKNRFFPRKKTVPAKIVFAGKN